MIDSTTPPHTVLPPERWHPLHEAHQERVQQLLVDHRARKAAGIKHPIEDFMWVYYSYSPTRLASWHPGYGVGLLEAERHSWPPFHQVRHDLDAPMVVADVAAWWAQYEQRTRRLMAVLTATAARVPTFHCFGLHEWAMVYQAAGERRHEQLPLRLTGAEIDDVVRSATVRCTHFDAFRFFTPPARGLNERKLTRATQVQDEQPGCLHAGMDLYRFAFQCVPVVAAHTVVDAFEFARAARILDMRASPYDVSEYGLTPVRIETAHGRAEYAAEQKKLSERGQVIRAELLQQLQNVLPEELTQTT